MMNVRIQVKIFRFGLQLFALKMVGSLPLHYQIICFDFSEYFQVLWSTGTANSGTVKAFLMTNGSLVS